MSLVAHHHVVLRLPADQVVVQGAQVTGTLTDFPVMLTEDHISSYLWSTADASGCDLRAYSDAALSQPLALDVVRWNPADQEARLRIKMPSLSAGNDASIYLATRDGEQLPDADSTYGRESVYGNAVVYDYFAQDGVGLDRGSNRQNIVDVTYPLEPEAHEMYFPSDPTYNYAAFARLIRLIDGRLFAVWRQGQEHGDAFDSKLVIAVSTDEGWSWTVQHVIYAGTIDYRAAHPIQYDDGSLMVVSTHRNFTTEDREIWEYHCSDPNDLTSWSSQQVTPIPSNRFQAFATPILIQNGPYSGYTALCFYDFSGPSQDVYLGLRDSSGAWTFQNATAADADDYNETSLLEKSDGSGDLLLLARNETDTDLYLIEFDASTDSFNSPVKKFTQSNTNGLSHPGQMIRHSNGDIFVSWGPDRDNGYGKISRSSDDLATIASDEAWYVHGFPDDTYNLRGMYGDLVELKDRSLGCAYYQDTASQLDARLYWARVGLDADGRLPGLGLANNNSIGMLSDGTNKPHLTGETVSAGPVATIHQTGQFCVSFRGQATSASVRVPIFGNTISSTETGFVLYREDDSVGTDAVRIAIFRSETNVPVVNAIWDNAWSGGSGEVSIQLDGNGSQVTLYVDGEAYGSPVAYDSTAFDTGAATSPLNIFGVLYDGTLYHNVTALNVLEFRSQPKGADWAATIHNNLSSPNTFAILQ